MEIEQKKREKQKIKLDKIYNQNSFKPAIHRDNDVKAVVFEKNKLYKDLKK